MRILSLCDYTGNMLKPWTEGGHYCVAIDIAQDAPGVRDGIRYVKGDVFDLGGDLSGDLSGGFDFIFAFPPCTDLAVSGARWWESKGIRATIESLQLVEACLTICQTARIGWMLENPIGRLANLWRKPDHKFDPCDYGDPYTKKTCLWTGGSFVMPEKNRVPATLGSMMHTLPPTKDRARIRSTTPIGFAQAVCDANGGN